MKAPKIRFQGFDGDWEEKKLGEVVDVCSGKDYKHLDEGDIPVYGTGGYMLSVSEALSDVDAIGIGRKGTIDNPYILKAPFWTVDTLFYCIPKGINLDFLYSVYQKIDWKSMDESTGVPSLSKTAINASNITIPQSSSEQQKIGSYLSHLDSLISLHQRKSDDLKEVKKYMLQKMFPKKGEKVPEIRFAGFTGDWEECKLSEIVNVMDGDRGKNYPKDVDFSEEGHTLFLNASNVTNQGFSFSNMQFITEDKSNRMRNGKLQLDDIVLTSRGSLGHIGWYNADIMSIVPYARINSGMLILRKKSNVSTSYINQYMKSAKGQRQIEFMSFGSAQPQLTQRGIEDLKVQYPKDFTEQEKLGSYFENLDSLITLHQRKSDELKTVKKYMLQKMFV